MWFWICVLNIRTVPNDNKFWYDFGEEQKVLLKDQFSREDHLMFVDQKRYKCIVIKTRYRKVSFRKFPKVFSRRSSHIKSEGIFMRLLVGEYVF